MSDDDAMNAMNLVGIGRQINDLGKKSRKRTEETCGRGHSKPCCTFTGGGDADESTHD